MNDDEEGSQHAFAPSTVKVRQKVLAKRNERPIYLRREFSCGLRGGRQNKQTVIQP